MSFIRVTLCQFDPVWQQPEQSCLQLSAQLASVPSSDLFILPEMFASGFSMQPQKFVEQFDVAKFLQNLAAKRGQNMIAGIAEGDAGVFHNNSLALNDWGEVVARYHKRRCFTHAGEDKIYQAGSRNAVIEIAGVKTALFVCYDLRFPELFREVAKQVEMIVVIANWPESRQGHWQALLIARAIENQCFVIGVNRSGIDGNDLKYAGGSIVIDPNGEVLLQMQDELFAHIEIDTGWVKVQRQRFAFLEDY